MLLNQTLIYSIYVCVKYLSVVDLGAHFIGGFCLIDLSVPDRSLVSRECGYLVILVSILSQFVREKFQQC
jgi:hypothetical protein